MLVLLSLFLSFSPFRGTAVVSGKYAIEQHQAKSLFKKSYVMRKPVFGVCDQVRLKPACSAVETSKRLEISDIETRGIILSRQ